MESKRKGNKNGQKDKGKNRVYGANLRKET